MIRHTLLLAILCVGTVFFALAQHSDDSDKTVPMGYELYSWPGKGDWSFSLVPSPSGANVSAEEVFNKKFVLGSVKELKRKISALPPGTTVYWPNRIAGASDRLSYPAPATIKDIKKYAESHQIKMEVLSDGQDQR